MQRWMNSLPAGTTVTVLPGRCYLVNEGLRITGAQSLTISGGTWQDATTPAPGASPTAMTPVFWLVGGSGITLQNLTIIGTNPGAYRPSGAFAAGVRSDGVIGLSMSNLTINNVFGDGVELAPLRAANDLSNVIVNPTRNASLNHLAITGAGRQGITLASVTNATISAVVLNHIGINAFDVEADQWDEGATNVTINGCVVGGDLGGLFFANGGAGAGGYYTGNITVANCTMTGPLAGDVILVQPPALQPKPRGPFTFVNDILYCGSSVYVSCVQATDARISVTGSKLIMQPGTIHEPVYHAAVSSNVAFGEDAVTGYGLPGWTDPTSTVTVSGGSWTPFGSV